MKANQAEHKVSRMCEVLGVSKSGYYAWLKRGPSAHEESDQRLAEQVVRVHQASRGTYGAPRILAELRAGDLHAGRKRIARLMREQGLQGVSRRKGFRTTIRGRERHGIPDLVNRKFRAEAPNQVWVADITYVPTRAGFLFLAVVLDVFSRRVVGWSMADHLRTELVMDALKMALQVRRPRQVIHHSDQGTQYTSVAFGKCCQDAGIRPSVGSVGDCYDNALAESFFATLECELLDREHFETRAAAKRSVFSFIEGWYNTRRRHSALGQLSPAEFEARHFATAASTVNSQDTPRYPQVMSLPPGPPSDPASNLGGCRPGSLVIR